MHRIKFIQGPKAGVGIFDGREGLCVWNAVEEVESSTG